LPVATPPEPPATERMQPERRRRMDAGREKDQARAPAPGRQRQRRPRAGPAPAEARRHGRGRTNAPRARPPRERHPHPTGPCYDLNALHRTANQGIRPRTSRPNDPHARPPLTHGRINAGCTPGNDRRTWRNERKQTPECPTRRRTGCPRPADAHNRRRCKLLTNTHGYRLF
jgi:hypothetical protein